MFFSFPTGLREYCEWESFNATCGRDEVIVMRTAKYGRMRLGKCVTKNYGHIGCGTDVLGYMESQCSGRRHCLVNVISLHNKRSCPKDFKSYLQASYSCKKGKHCRILRGFVSFSLFPFFISETRPFNSTSTSWQPICRPWL